MKLINPSIKNVIQNHLNHIFKFLFSSTAWNSRVLIHHPHDKLRRLDEKRSAKGNLFHRIENRWFEVSVLQMNFSALKYSEDSRRVLSRRSPPSPSLELVIEPPRVIAKNASFDWTIFLINPLSALRSFGVNLQGIFSNWVYQIASNHRSWSMIPRHPFRGDKKGRFS